MRTIGRAPVSALVLIGILASPLAAQQTATGTTPVTLSPEQMEAFLLNAKLVSSRRIGEGVTGALRGTFTDGTVTHDAQIQTVDEARAIFDTPKGIELNFRDSYKYNIAAYKLATYLGMDNVPISVVRNVQGRDAAVTWWLDGVMMDEGDRVRKRATGPDPSRYASFVHTQRVFDELIANTDRNLGNILWTADWTMWLIDHTRAFRTGRELRNPKLLERVERTMLARMRGLDRARVQELVGDTLNELEIDAVSARADLLVRFFEDRIAKSSEGQVLYTKR